MERGIPNSSACEKPEAADALKLRVVRGLHRGALTALAPSEMVLIGAGEDCDVILSDTGVAQHHCVLSNVDSKLFVRAIEAPLLLDGVRHDPGKSLALAVGAPVELGSAAFDVLTARDCATAAVELPTAPSGFLRARFGFAAGWFRNLRWVVVGTLGIAVAVACGLNSVQLGLKSRNAQGTHAPVQQLAASRPGTAIAHDVEEVLRLSDVDSEAHYDGNGTVTVRGHLGNGKTLATIIQSRAMREIVGLKRVLAINLDDPHGGATPTQVDSTRIVSVVSSADPYVVTADGSRYYVGAELPQGGRLVGVDGDEVLIERNGQVEHLKLPAVHLGSSNHQEKRT